MAFSRRELRELEDRVETLRENWLARGGTAEDGGPGSGNWGHRGVPGKHGGSAPGGGLHNRREVPGTSGKYTSFSKQRAMAARPHKISLQEMMNCPNGAVLLAEDGTRYRKVNGEFETEDKKPAPLTGLSGRVVIPEKNNPNLQKGVDHVDFGGYRERMEKAPRYESKGDVDDFLREGAGEVWKSLSSAQKDALYEYTNSKYRDINSLLRTGATMTGARPDGVAAMCSQIQKAIDQSEVPRDMWTQRILNTDGLSKMLNMDEGDLMKVISGDIPASSLAGLTAKDNGFMSTTSTSERGGIYTGPGRNAVIHVFLPKGTKALYCEPFSCFGEGAQRWWDGEEKQRSYSDEFETLIQCGTAVQVSRAWVEDSQLHVEVFPTGQEAPQ